MSDTIDYPPLPERHDHQVVDDGFAGAVAEALGVAKAEAGVPTPSALLALGPEGGSLSRTAASCTAASRTAAAEALAVAEALGVAEALAVVEALGVVEAEDDGGLPTPSSRSPGFAWGAVIAPASLASRAAGAAGAAPSWVWVARETTGGRWSAERSS
jgi:hypothetical protein